jgi:uncharacterized membrane protein
MNPRFDLTGHLTILVILLLTVYGQLVLKWQISAAGPMPESMQGKVLFILQQLINPWVISGFAAAFAASLAWMVALTRFELNYAYPFMSLAFVLVMGFSVLFLGEALSTGKIIGTLLVMAGLVVIART